MQEAIDKRKQQEWLHIEQQYKNYKRNFQGRPLIPKQVSTYLEITNFITQLIPAFSEHYFQNLTHEENMFINQVFQSVSCDMQAKIKGLAYRIQKKEIQESNSKDEKTICKACLHELRAAQIAEAKQQLQSKQFLTRNIMKIIKEVEEASQTYSIEEDRRFFKELKAALKKKQELLELCQIEGNQFVDMIEEQLKGILIERELFIFQQDKSYEQTNIRGYQLKENVTKSLKTHINEKIPEIIKLVANNLKKMEEKNKKLKAINAEVQTLDAQTPKVIQLRRRITILQVQLNAFNGQKTKLNTMIQQKTLTIEKYQKQLKVSRDQFDAKVFNLQKELKSLQDKNRKLKQDLQKQKSRRIIQSTEHNLKSMNSIAQFKDQSVVEDAPDEIQRDFSRKSKRKKTITNLTKTSGKFYLPTLKKISNQDESIIPENTKKQENQQQNTTHAQFLDQANQPNDITAMSSIQPNVSKVSSKANIASKDRNRSRKKGERMMTISNGKDKNEEQAKMKKQSSCKTIKSERGESPEMADQQGKENTLPLLKSDKNKVVNIQKKNKSQIKRLNKEQKQPKDKIVRNHIQKSDHKQQQKQKQMIQMRKEAQLVNERLKERSSVHSSASNQGKSSINKATRQSIYKLQQTNEQQSIEQSPSTYLGDNLLSQKKQEVLKYHLRNSFSKIKEQIDKQNFQTSIGSQSPDIMENLKKIQKNKFMKHHLFQIYRELTKESKQLKDMINITQFSQIFQKYVAGLNENSNNKDQPQNDESMVAAITEPILPRIKQSINKSSLNLKQIKENKNYSSVNQLKKESQKYDLSMLKSRLSGQVSALKSKESSLDASYHISPRIDEEQLQLGKQHRKQDKISTLLTLQKLLFFNDQCAYRYQTSLSKKKDKSASKLTPQIEQYLTSLFDTFQKIKLKNPSYYQQISGFLRYPFSHSRNGFLQIDIIKHLSLNTLIQCFLRLMYYHQKCEKDGIMCAHLLNFKKRVEEYCETV